MRGGDEDFALWWDRKSFEYFPNQNFYVFFRNLSDLSKDVVSYVEAVKEEGKNIGDKITFTMFVAKSEHYGTDKS